MYSIFLNHPLISTDTRNIAKGGIFFALKGPNFNANKFAGEALEKGAEYAVIDDPSLKDSNFILVEDVLTSLQQLAAFHRDHLDIPFIGITGSNGKTTTKELIKASLEQKYKTFATKGNLNNHIGVPLSVLSVRPDHEMAIIEMGANHLGEIASLCQISKPDFGIITNIGKAHIEGFGSFEGVKKAKGELYSFIASKAGKLFINNDNEILREIAPDIEKITYGSGENCFCYGELIKSSPFLELNWKCPSNETGMQELNSQLYGSYNFENILAAICIGNYFKVPPTSINKAINEYIPSNNRSQIIKNPDNTIYLDAYNANPSSMESAIQTFSLVKNPNKLFILGDMLELGDISGEEHRKIIETLLNKEMDKVLLVGSEFQKACKGEFPVVNDYKEALEYLQKGNWKGFDILIKGSRGIQLEKLAPELSK